MSSASNRMAATIAPTMMPISAPLLRPVLVAAGVVEAGGGGGAADVADGVAEEVDDVVGVSMAVADLTAPMPD